MMYLAQAAVETVKSSSYVTGHFVIDGVLLIAGLKVVEAVISKVRPKVNGKGPKPGEAKTCGDHGKAIEEQGKAIAGLVEFKETARETLTKVDAKLDRLIEKFIGKA